MQFPYTCTGSLSPTFVPDRGVPLPVKHPYAFALKRPVTNRPEGTFGSLRYAFGGDHPSQTARQAVSTRPGVRTQTAEGPYFNAGSTGTGVPDSQPPAYPTHPMTKSSAKLQ